MRADKVFPTLRTCWALSKRHRSLVTNGQGQSLFLFFCSLISSFVLPRCAQTEQELTDMARQTHYVAGFTDVSIEGREDLFDIVANGSLICQARRGKKAPKNKKSISNTD